MKKERGRVWSFSTVILTVAVVANSWSQMKILDIDDIITEGKWYRHDGPEGTPLLVEQPKRKGRHALCFRVRIMHHAPDGSYQVGWPSISLKPNPPLDWTQYDHIEFFAMARVIRNVKPRYVTMRFIFRRDLKSKRAFNKPLPPLVPGQWRKVRLDISDAERNNVGFIHFYCYEGDYNDGAEFEVFLDDFRLTAGRPKPPKPTGLKVELRFDPESRPIRIPVTARVPPAAVRIQLLGDSRLTGSERLRMTFRELFSGWRLSVDKPLPASRMSEGTREVRFSVDVGSVRLRPGYYSVIAGVVREGNSLCNGRVGSADLYVAASGETEFFSLGCQEIGAAKFRVDRKFGGLMRILRNRLPPTYDPLSDKTYHEFLRAYAVDTCKFQEIIHDGLTGLIPAMRALDSAGYSDRAQYTEEIVENTLRFLVEQMQDPETGAVSTAFDDLLTFWPDLPPGQFGNILSVNSAQVGEFAISVSLGYLYFRNKRGRKSFATYLAHSARKAADFLIKCSTDEWHGFGTILRDFQMPRWADHLKTRRLRDKSQTPCVVYEGRVLSGVAWPAVVSLLEGQPLPEQYWKVMRNDVRWSVWMMSQADGLFDHYCGDTREGGCHTFLGNEYLAEGLIAVHAAASLAARTELAQMAKQAAKMAVDYWTKKCVIRGHKFTPGSSGFWDTGYGYFVLREYLSTVTRDPAVEQFAKAMVAPKAEMLKKMGHVGGVHGLSIVGPLVIEGLGRRYEHLLPAAAGRRSSHAGT